MKRDQVIFDLIEREHQRQLKGMELIASENFVSDEVMQAMGSCLTNKYAEGLPGKRYYGGCQVVDQVEDLARERVKQLFDAEWANVQPHSGAQANAAVLLTVLNPGDTFMGLNLAHGGHLSHGSAVNTSGILYKPVGYNLNKETGRVDYDEMERLAQEHKPKLIIGGGSAYSREWDYKRMREIADSVGALLMVDMAHPAGLIAAGLLDNPLRYAHIVTSTTHKTLRGPRGGIILLGKDFDNPWGKTTPKGVVKKMSQLLDSAVFPGTQGGPLEHVIAAKAVAFGEALQPEFKAWALQVQKNARVLADELMKRGFGIVSGGTDNHSMLVDLRTKYPDLTGKVAENALVSADITVNKNMVPFDTRSAFQTSGIRLGTPALTTRGAKEDLMVLIAELIEEVLNAPEDEKVIASVRARVNDTMKLLVGDVSSPTIFHLSPLSSTMALKKKKKTKKNEGQLMLFSSEEMLGKELSPDSSKDAVTIQEEETEDKGVSVNTTTTENISSDDKPIATETPAMEPKEVVGTPLLSDIVNDDPFAPFIDDPKSTSERIVHEMVAAMTLLDRFSVNQVRLIAMQASPIAQSGVDFSKTYQLPSLPGFTMNGYSMLALSYVSFKRVFPNMIDRLDQDFTKEYELALKRFKD